MKKNLKNHINTIPCFYIHAIVVEINFNGNTAFLCACNSCRNCFQLKSHIKLHRKRKSFKGTVKNVKIALR